LMIAGTLAGAEVARAVDLRNTCGSCHEGVRGTLRRTMTYIVPGRRACGQNFLASRAIAAQLVRQAKVGCGDLVLEIGAGNGILTAELARQAPRVFAVEIDPVWVARLRERFAGSAFERGQLARSQNGTRQPSFR